MFESIAIINVILMIVLIRRQNRQGRNLRYVSGRMRELINHFRKEAGHGGS
ncbi:hypothetical protein C943_03280 [Mariniradius saccharolyticus AK6]|uniref:Uncharacterized protein n=2 Tax=Mariniradius TaxID=1245590 RepID=M7XJ58_9BACT|nr:hypothetical protein C943_03280 [Mariniradius saccharolyticus AK6]